MDKNPINIFNKWLDKGCNSSFWTHCVRWHGFLSWHYTTDLVSNKAI